MENKFVKTVDNVSGHSVQLGSMNLDQVLAKLKKKQGDRSLREFATALGCSAPFLSDVYRKQRRPGPRILKALRVKSIVTVDISYREEK